MSLVSSGQCNSGWRYVSNSWGLYDGEEAPALVDFWRTSINVSGALTETLQRVERRFKAMGGPARVVLMALPSLSAELGGLFAEIEQLVAELEQRYSRYRDDDLVSVINRRAGSPQRTKIDAETIALLGLAGRCGRPPVAYSISPQGRFDAPDFRLKGPVRPERIEAARD